jgi:oxygen-independent coproporphyrinogen-3 oxidase
MLWEGADLAALGVASFGHLSGIHYQNATHWDDYLGDVEAGRLPIRRGLVPTRHELLTRETVLGLKKGRLDVARLREKFGVDVLAEWADQWRTLEAAGHLAAREPEPVLSRGGLLQVDSLLPAFFGPPTAGG